MIDLVSTPVTDASLEMAAKDKDCILAFWEQNCPHCIEMIPIVETLAGKYRNALSLLTARKQDVEQTGFDMKIAGFPTFVFLKQGKETGRFQGSTDSETFENWIKARLQEG